MSTVFQNFPREAASFINPADCVKPLLDFPEICITTFSQNIITEFIENNDTEIIAYLYTANGMLPVYQVKYKNMSVGLFLSRVGAPACVAGLEEIIALGAKKIVQFGSCGILNQSAVNNKIIIPASAIRDEGTSYHYIEASDEITAETSSVNIAIQCLEKHNIPYISGKIWTTDGIYRETSSLIQTRRAQGCLAVDMECSASLAAAKFRNIPIIQFLFGADNLDADIWEQRDLTDYGFRSADKYILLAFELAAAFKEENQNNTKYTD